MTQIPQADLRFGHEHPTLDLNVRHGDREPDEALIASIRQNGLLMPLLVWRDPAANGTPYVFDGNRRLGAIRIIDADGPGWVGDVDCVAFGGDPAAILALSADANTVRAPLHELDEFELVVALKLAGWSDEKVGEKLRLSALQVRRRRALGALAPEVRKAWRDGLIDRETAQVFTLAHNNPERQAEHLTRWLETPDWQRYRHTLTRELVGGGAQLPTEIEFLGGRTKAEALGVEFVSDLFGEATYVLNPDKVRELVEAAVRDECARLATTGGFGAATHVAVAGWYERTPVIRPDGGIEAIEEKGDLTVYVRPAAEEGKFVYDVRKPPRKAAADGPGLTRQEGARIRDGKGSVAETKSLDGTPSTVADALWSAQTRAIADLLRADPEAALIACIASLEGALAGGPSSSPVRIGNGARGHVAIPRRFDEAIAQLRDATIDDLMTAFAEQVAQAVRADAFARLHNGVTRKGVGAVLSLFAFEDAHDALFSQFDVDRWVAEAGKPRLTEALTDILGGADAKKAIAGKKVAEIAAEAAPRIRAARWLPQDLRPPGWDDNWTRSTPFAAERVVPPAPDAVPKVEDDGPPTRPPSGKWNGAQKEAFAKLREAGAVDLHTGTDAVHPATAGSLIKFGRAAKGKRPVADAPHRKETVYWLTASGIEEAEALAAAKRKGKKANA